MTIGVDRRKALDAPIASRTSGGACRRGCRSPRPRAGEERAGVRSQRLGFELLLGKGSRGPRLRLTPGGGAPGNGGCGYRNSRFPDAVSGAPVTLPTACSATPSTCRTWKICTGRPDFPPDTDAARRTWKIAGSGADFPRNGSNSARSIRSGSLATGAPAGDRPRATHSWHVPSRIRVRTWADPRSEGASPVRLGLVVIPSGCGPPRGRTRTGAATLSCAAHAAAQGDPLSYARVDT